MDEKTVGQTYETAADGKEIYIRRRIEEQIAYYEGKSRQNKMLYLGISLAAVVPTR